MKPISIAVICENEEETLPLLFKAVESLGDLVEKAVFIDNFSVDTTPQLIQNWKPEFPVIFKQHELDSFSKQKNRALDECETDWIFALDADMTFTSNFRESFLTGFFNSHIIWDFPLYYTIIDKYHYSNDRNSGSATTRFFRGNIGLRYQWDVHEHILFPKEDNSEWTEEERQKGFEATHKPEVLRVCDKVFIFENSLLISDEGLKVRGARRMAFAEKSSQRGIPYSPNTYYEAKKRGVDEFNAGIFEGVKEFSEDTKKLII